MIASVVTALIFFVLTYLFPHKPKQIKDYDKLILVNEYKYKIYELLSVVFLFFVIGAICYFFYLLGSDLQTLYFRGRTTDFSIYPPDSFWLVPGLCFGFGLLGPPIELLYRMLLGDEYDVFEEYTSRKYGINNDRLGKFLFSLCIAAGLAFSFLGLGWYKEIKGDKIIIDDFDSLTPQEYTVQQIESITHYKYKRNSKGEAVAEPHYQIRFSDGRVWDTSSNFHEVSQEKYDAIVAHLLSQTGLKLRHQETHAAAQ